MEKTEAFNKQIGMFQGDSAGFRGLYRPSGESRGFQRISGTFQYVSG